MGTLVPKRRQGALTSGEEARSHADADGMRVIFHCSCGRVGGRGVWRETYGPWVDEEIVKHGYVAAEWQPK